ncbi:VirB8/TrbF family protein [Muricoccus radiodurans]|uniref:VirB8/TrbF family protein n=1 Tax=Muricoccus radiodurans TaxID=2231721 RepID=UPI003CFB0A4B
MSPPAASAEQVLHAADIVIPAGELDRALADRRREEARRRRREAWRGTGRSATIVAQWGVIFALMAFIWVRPPQTAPVPIIVYQRPDGTVTNHAEWDSLPAQVRRDSTVNVVWTYVQQRESWNEGNAGWAWQVVSALSSPALRDQFQAWYRRENPDSPARRYRDGTTIEAQYVNWGPVCPIEGCRGDPDAYRIWFKRVETPPGGQPIDRGTYAATVRVLRNVPIPQDRIWQRWTFNAPQIQVIDYTGPQREGVTP